MSATLLVELLTEELPPKALKFLSEAFGDGIASGLRQRGLLTKESVARPYATPRRLAVLVDHVQSVAPDTEVVDRLMPAKIAWDAASQPTEAYKRKLAAIGRSQDEWPPISWPR